MADTKKEYTSNLHPKGDMDTTVYPNVKSENIIDKDTTAYTAGKVPDSSLVSRSLDGLNEKIETNKIQTETNKTNIATLQGDVSSLKQDNETTKTTIAGLVSADTQNKANIAKNTQDISTLKANYTEVQSQANTNSSNIALLESNAIKKDTDASLKSLTLPSSKDLKTKDGSSFGGGGSLTGFRTIINRGGTTKKISTEFSKNYDEISNIVFLELKNGIYTAGQIVPQTQRYTLNYVKNGNRVSINNLNSEYVFNPNGLRIVKAYIENDETKTFNVSMETSNFNRFDEVEVEDKFIVRTVSDVTIDNNNYVLRVEMIYFG